MIKQITTREAWEKGRRSQRTASDWDDALARFSTKYCAPHSPIIMCELERAWADGWDSMNETDRPFDASRYERDTQ